MSIHTKTLKRISASAGLFMMLLLGAVMVTSCGGNAPAEEITINIMINEFEVIADRTDIPTGAIVTFNITNEGALSHELVLEVFNAVDEPMTFEDGGAVEAEDIEPGDTVTLVYTFGEDGAYQLACHVPFHYEAGMTTGLSVGGAELPEADVSAAAGGGDGVTYTGNGECDVRTVNLIGQWIEAGAPDGAFDFLAEDNVFCEGDFTADVLPLFTEEGAWFPDSQSCTECHFAASEDSYHEMDLSNHAGILAGADTLEAPPGASILGESSPGAGDYNWEESELRARLRNNRMPAGWEFDITEENRDGPTLSINGDDVRAVHLIGDWVAAGLPENDSFGDYGATFADHVLPLFTDEGAWFTDSESCTQCHFAATEDSYHEMDLSTFGGILAGADSLEDPPGVSLFGESSPGAGDFNWDESKLEARLRNNRMPPGTTFDITEENRDGPTIQAGKLMGDSSVPGFLQGLLASLTMMFGMVVFVKIK